LYLLDPWDGIHALFSAVNLSKNAVCNCFFHFFLPQKKTMVEKQGIVFAVRKPLILLESFKIYRWGWQRRMWR
jgi:hypothetical protein